MLSPNSCRYRKAIYTNFLDLTAYTYNLANLHLYQIETKTSIYGARSSELFISVEKNNYHGLDVLAHLEKLNDDLYYAGSKGENYQKVALECFNYIELIYSNESEFNMMYPMIQLLVAKEAECALAVMMAYTYPNQRMTSEYTLLGAYLVDRGQASEPDGDLVCL